nr:hypothetical protein [Tanacetum cinerariifolium]
LENASKSLNKLIDCHIVDNCKKGLGYESYNAVPPPYTGNFMPPKPDLSYTGLDEFVVKHLVENKSSEEETKAVRKNPDAFIIKEYYYLTSAAVQSSQEWHLFSSGSGNFLHWHVIFTVAALLFFWQWQLSSLAVGSSSTSGNSITGSGNALCILFPIILP